MARRRRGRQRRSDEVTNTHEFHEGIEIEIFENNSTRPHGHSLVHQGFTAYGRSVRFADGTPYSISIKNNTDKHAAVNVTIDGRKVNLTPILLYRKKRRDIKGFDLTRQALELENDEYELRGTYDPFIAQRPTPATGASTHVDHRIGTIQFEFLATRYAPRQPGRRLHLKASKAQQAQSNARAGVLATSGAGRAVTKTGKHFQGEEDKSGRRPVADRTRPLDPAIPSCEIIICEKHHMTFEDVVPS